MTCHSRCNPVIKDNKKDPWGPRCKKSKRAKAALESAYPLEDWAQPTTPYHPANGVDRPNTCCRHGFRSFNPYNGRIGFKVKFCNYCYQCMYEGALRVTAHLATVARRLQGRVYVQVFCLADFS